MTLQASTESATPILIETAKQSPQKQQLRKDSGQEKKKKKWLQIRDALKLAHFKIAFPEATNIFSPGKLQRSHSRSLVLTS
ncbi:unnamed protein product [Anisakis simplex]|uniref:Uncharacterized protein n=1 Tax=Anisakis simplex TaxID=6269 RepID=A0A0M3K053_ANISI|nr:unnamed protein product [Anisakis simplex]